VKHFITILPALEKIKMKYGNRVRFTLIGDESYSYPPLNISGIKWQQHTEVAELKKLDIGIMPLPDDEWSKGKCGFKGLLYMSLGIPAILSPVGVNQKIIRDGVNGFLASSESEWVDKLSRLIEDPELRRKLGTNGRQEVVSHYSVFSQQQKYLSLFQQLTALPSARHPA